MSNHDMTCGDCGRTWNEKETPTPAARCPFEYEHEPENTWKCGTKIENYGSFISDHERPEWAHEYMRYDGMGWICDGCPHEFCDCDEYI